MRWGWGGGGWGGLYSEMKAAPAEDDATLKTRLTGDNTHAWDEQGNATSPQLT